MLKIVLLGYMGSGKSTIAQLLSKSVSIDSLDLDQIIEKKEEKSIKDIFKERGEIYFRKIESQVFNNLMGSEEEMILSIGGGTPCYANNHELLKKDGVVSIYLKASVEELYARLLLEKENRPLIATKDAEELKEYIAKHLFDRSYYYNQAKHKISVDGKSPDEIVAEIIKVLA
ncbi:shikimate kinase [Flavobacterium sp. '19STA2R22 D10 B1']|uniref:shikimate kinase n=1 Tax=Flavobacterium aerium TaxID=3037261 RepID=UPI00278BD12C|nr:shikimate kinase [Flavobacterium sp. '19STA2R22 D10 B1']